LGRFLPVFVPFFALFPSMSCAYLYVNNYFSASLAWDLLTSNRKVRKARKGRFGEQRTRKPEPGNRKGDGENGTAFNAAGHGRGRSPARESAEGDSGNGERQRGTRNVECGMKRQNGVRLGASPWSAAEKIPQFLFPFLLETPAGRVSRRAGISRPAGAQKGRGGRAAFSPRARARG
jgi:hypothetical protein